MTDVCAKGGFQKNSYICRGALWVVSQQIQDGGKQEAA